jgi:hypothetical protein
VGVFRCHLERSRVPQSHLYLVLALSMVLVRSRCVGVLVYCRLECTHVTGTPSLEFDSLGGAQWVEISWTHMVSASSIHPRSRVTCMDRLIPSGMYTNMYIDSKSVGSISFESSS